MRTIHNLNKTDLLIRNPQTGETTPYNGEKIMFIDISDGYILHTLFDDWGAVQDAYATDKPLVIKRDFDNYMIGIYEYDGVKECDAVFALIGDTPIPEKWTGKQIYYAILQQNMWKLYPLMERED